MLETNAATRAASSFHAEAERQLVRAAAERGVAVDGLGANRYPHRARDESSAAVIVGYAAAPEHGYQAAVRALVRA